VGQDLDPQMRFVCAAECILTVLSQGQRPEKVLRRLVERSSRPVIKW
jgi:hypothetical protein